MSVGRWPTEGDSESPVDGEYVDGAHGHDDKTDDEIGDRQTHDEHVAHLHKHQHCRQPPPPPPSQSASNILTYTHARAFNGPLSGTTRVSRYQKGKTSLDFTEVRDSEWQWHQLDHMQVYTSLQTDDHTSTPPFHFRCFDAVVNCLGDRKGIRPVKN